MENPQKAFLATMAGVVASGAMALHLGFMLQEAYPRIPDGVLGTLVACSWAVLAWGVYLLVRPRPLSTQSTSAPTTSVEEHHVEIKREAAISQATLQEARRLRIAELAADPGKASYVPLMERGEWWTDEQIAYRENPKATATCAHLQPVERAMRAAGIVPRRLTEPWYRGFATLAMVEADCRINQAELPRFHLPGSVQYASGYSPERSEWDNPWARLTCGVCASRIDLVHPEYPRTTTVWFPSPPE